MSKFIRTNETILNIIPSGRSLGGGAKKRRELSLFPGKVAHISPVPLTSRESPLQRMKAAVAVVTMVTLWIFAFAFCLPSPKLHESPHCASNQPKRKNTYTNNVIVDHRNADIIGNSNKL